MTARQSRASRWLTLAALGGVSAALVLSELTVCPFANLTGHPCPGCGLTRASLALLRGDLASALALHPLVVMCLPLVGLFAADGVLSALLGRNLGWSAAAVDRLRISPNWLWGSVGGLLLVVWIARFFGSFGGPVSVEMSAVLRLWQ